VCVCVCVSAPVEPECEVDHSELISSRDILHLLSTGAVTLQDAVTSQRPAGAERVCVCVCVCV
jgi:hypothetical protein